MNALKNKNDQNHSTLHFEKGQELIWDSGAGFDVVNFSKKSKILDGKMADCQMKTGIRKGKVIPIDYSQLNIFSLEKWGEMRKKYDAC